MEKCSLKMLFDKFEIQSNDLNEIAFQTGFIKRVRSVSASDILFSICSESVHGTVSYNDIASNIESEGGASVSRQAIWKKVTEPCRSFFEKVLGLVILAKLDKTEIDYIIRKSHYKRILVQDSTIIRLPTKLFEEYSGAINQCSTVCNARIQGVYDILNEHFVTFSIDPYTKNDFTSAPELELREGDLSLRDRGYLIYDEIQRHISVGADCIYRYRFGTILLDTHTEQPINLLEKLKAEKVLDMVVKLKNKNKTLVRITAAPVDQEIANKRRMKARQEKKRLLQPNTYSYFHGPYSLQPYPKSSQTTKTFI